MAERHLGIVIPAYNEEATIDKVLRSLNDQTDLEATRIFLIDNASTDSTPEIAARFAWEHEDFPLTIITENEQGTGCASDTGFKTAIDAGYPLIARTDGDTLPATNWAQKIKEIMARTDAQLIGGSRRVLKDEHYRWYDSILWPLGLQMGDLACRLAAKEKRGHAVVGGCNMATRSEAYLQAVGFPRTRIEDADEDAVYVERIVSEYGPDAVKVFPGLEVYTSMRRLRRIGYMGMLGLRLESLMGDGRRNSTIADGNLESA